MTAVTELGEVMRISPKRLPAVVIPRGSIDIASVLGVLPLTGVTCSQGAEFEASAVKGIVNAAEKICNGWLAGAGWPVV